MKFLKVAVCAFLLVFMLLSCFTVGAKNEYYDILLENGFTEEYLDKLSESMIEIMAQKVIENTKPQNESTETQKELPEGILSELSDEGLKHLDAVMGECEIVGVDIDEVPIYDNGHLKMKKAVVCLADKNSTNIAKEVVILCWEWEEKRPLISREDHIAIRFNGEVLCFEPDSFYAEDCYKDSATEKWTVAKSYNKLAEAELHGIGHYTKVYATKNQTGGMMIFSLTPTAPVKRGEKHDNSIYVSYDSSIYKHEYKQVIIAVLCISLILIVMFSGFAVAKKRRK